METKEKTVVESPWSDWGLEVDRPMCILLSDFPGICAGWVLLKEGDFYVPKPPLHSELPWNSYDSFDDFVKHSIRFPARVVEDPYNGSFFKVVKPCK